MFNSLLFRRGVWLLAAFALFTVPACSDDDAVNPGAGAPIIPSMSTMLMDLSFFGFGTPGTVSLKDVDVDAIHQSSTGRVNYINGAVRALYVNLLMYDAFEAPIGAFAVAINSVPQRQPDDTWLWTYIFVEDAIDYSINTDHIR